MGLNIRIDRNYKITSDSNGINVCKRAKVKNKITNEMEKGWRPFLYYSDITSAIKGLLQHKIRVSNAESIAQLIEEIKTFDKKVQDALWLDRIQV